jgi:hypothetical protein
MLEAPLVTREVWPEIYFSLVIMVADAQARQFLQFQASYNFKHYTYEEPCKFSISLAASSISEI